MLGVCLLPAVAAAQLASSPNYQLLDDCMAGGGGGECSLNYSSFLSAQPFSGAEIYTTNFHLALGFLEACDPEPTNAPVIFGVAPGCGPASGGAPVTITGLNFNKFGAGPSVNVKFGSNFATGVSVSSDTLLNCVSPAGPSGIVNVQVASNFGSDIAAGAYTFSGDLSAYGTGTPGCAGPETVNATSCPNIGNAQFTITCTSAPLSSLGVCLVANAADVPGSDPFGLGVLLHLNLFAATEIISFDIVSDATATGYATVAIPNDNSLIGHVYYAQVLWVESACVMNTQYNLSSSRGLSITITP